MFRPEDTIAASATAPGGALSIIRLSGKNALTVCDSVFHSPSGKKLSEQKGNTVHFGNITDRNGCFVDEVLVTVFRTPASYTGEDMAEISCHGSSWIVSEIMRLLTEAGARNAEAGEFTVRAFLAGKLDLTQAEAVADMIASDSKAAHSIAANQLRGTFSAKLFQIRTELKRIAALLELELDFSEEDVEFAERTELLKLIDAAIDEIDSLKATFSLGNAIKEGIPVTIIGKPNVGKSTLLNQLLGDDRAMVSDIAGTTRDVIEEKININGINFRFIDTAGIRESVDPLERMGIERTYKALSQARIILYLIDGSRPVTEQDTADINSIELSPEQHIAVLINKCDTVESEQTCILPSSALSYPVIPISAKYGYNINSIKDFLISNIDTASAYGNHTIVSNARHYEALLQAAEALAITKEGVLSGIPTDLTALDLRSALDSIGVITGEITSQEILEDVFSKFCIGK